MILSREQLEERKNHLGASDVPAIFGLDPFRGPMDVWLEKTQPLTVEQKTNEAIQVGNMFEEPLLHWCSLVIDKPIVTGSIEARKGIFVVHPDAIVTGAPEGIEAKTTGKTGEWGKTSTANPTDSVPPHVVVQTQTQMMATKHERTWVPVLIPGFASLERRLYCVEQDPDTQELINDYCNQWWDKHVVLGEQPDLQKVAMPRREMLHRIVRDAGVWAEAPDELHEEYAQAKARFTIAKKQKELAEDKIKLAMGTAEGLRFEHAQKEMTFFQRDGKVSYGTGEDYDCCSECGVGKKQGEPYRVLLERKRSD